MRLRSAITIYSMEGPCDGRDGEVTARALASRVVHAYCTPDEVQKLCLAWRRSGASKAEFLKTLQAVRERLQAVGEL